MEEKRLIDADDLLIAFGNALNNATLKIGYGFMEQVVNEQPTVDPESMRGHARWLKDENVKIIDADAYGNTFDLRRSIARIATLHFLRQNSGIVSGISALSAGSR